MQMLLQILDVEEEKRLVFLDGPAQRAAELVPLKSRNRIAVEEIAGVEVAVAQELVSRSVELICPAARDDQNLSTRPFSVFRFVGIAEQVKFLNRVDTQQLLAGASRLHVVFSRAGEFH